MLLGHVTKVARYTFKSMAAEPIAAGFATYSGLQGDRLFSFVAKSARKDSPWVSAREVPQLVLFKPSFLTMPDMAVPFPSMNDYELEVTFPDGSRARSLEHDFLERLAPIVGRACEVRFSERSMVNARPLSLVSGQSIEALETEIGRDLDWRRFRANIYTRWIKPIPFLEDLLIGKRLRIGNKAEILISKKDSRCTVVTVDPNSGLLDPTILNHIVRHHGNSVGVYAVTLREGPVCVGDPICLIED